MELILSKPNEIGRPQLGLLTFVQQKKQAVEAQLKEREAALEKAVQNKWQTAPLRKIVNDTRKDVVYYEKVEQALEAGYMVMPPTTCEAFAVRVSEDARLPDSVTRKNPSGWEQPRWDLQGVKSDAPPAGEGEYVAPEVKFDVYWRESRENKPGETAQIVLYRTTRSLDFDQHVPFPVIIAKPELMNAAENAMALRIFDEISISPGRNIRKRDPIIIGRIMRRNREPLNFLVAWYVNENEI